MVPLGECRIGREGTVVRCQGVERVEQLDVTARREVAIPSEPKLCPDRSKIELDLREGLPKQPRPVQDGASQQSQVNEVERVDECPILFQVVNEELDVWRDAG
jgi:hypothetical protein